MPEFVYHDLTNNFSRAPYAVVASSIYYLTPAWHAFNGNKTLYWLGQNDGVDWLQVDVGPGNAYILQTYDIEVNTVPEPDRAPKNWKMRGSVDSVNWEDLDTVTNETGWLSGEKRSFTCDVQTTAYRYFRVDISANNGNSTYTQIAELYLQGVVGIANPVDFAPHAMTASNAPSPYVIAASSEWAFSAVEAFTGSYKLPAAAGWAGTGGGTDWLRLDLGAGNSKTLKSYIVQVNSVPEPNRAPKAWTMQGSNNGSDWSTLDTVTGQTSWTSGEARSFTCDVSTTAYRYFRINITENNGDTNYTQVGELYLLEEVLEAPPPPRTVPKKFFFNGQAIPPIFQHKEVGKVWYEGGSYVVPGWKGAGGPQLVGPFPTALLV